MINDFEPGQPMTPTEVAKLLGVCPNTVRKHYRRWGGVEVAPRLIRFYSNLLKEKLYAHAGQEDKQTPLEGGGHNSREEARATVPGRQHGKLPRGSIVGTSHQEGGPDSTDKNRYGLANLS